MPNQTSFQVYNASAGSGKTFTLVKEYLKILLQSTDDYLFQKILAITFTNKAAGEMKERVLSSLLAFSNESRGDMLDMMVADTGLEILVIQNRSKRILQSILQNYAAFQIKTIDSFTNKLIKSFAYDLGMSLDFEVELDVDSVFEEVIDIVISKIGVDKELTNILVTFAKQKTLEDKSWDISRELKDISKLLLSENHIYELQKIENKEIVDFKSLEKKLKKDQKEIEKGFVDLGEKGLDIIDGIDVVYKDFYYTDLPKFFSKLEKFKDLKPGDLKFEGRLYNSIQNGVLYGAKKPQSITSQIDSVSDELIALYFEIEKIYNENYATYQLNKLILKNIIPLAIIKSINEVLEEVKTDNNIRLNAEFNQIISEHLRSQPVAFIYEKIGEKFKHFFIDEMQDTSVLQWENLIPLIENALSEENASLLLVGDAKQAIYRWRGGKAEQFINLFSKESKPFVMEQKVNNLDTNYRSYSEIIDFNNLFFTHISRYFQKKAYQNLFETGNNQKFNNRKGGFVQLSFVNECANVEEKNEIFPEKIYEIILELDKQFDRNEICILVRKRDHGIAIANYLTDKHIEIVSSETLLIKNNEKVDFIIQMLSYLFENTNNDAKFAIIEYLYHHLEIQIDKHSFISNLVKLNKEELFKSFENYGIFYNSEKFDQSPFYESVEEIIRSFKLLNESDAYIQFFLDFVLEYTQRKSQNNAIFFEVWEQKKDKLSIVASDNKNAVQIMTIHKSKGLEFQVVIYPYDLDIYKQINPQAWYNKLNKEDYNNFDSILVSSSSQIEYTGDHGKEIFKNQTEELELDNFNLLYVALTRAKEQLFIISELKKAKDKLKLYSHFFIDFLKENDLWVEDKSVYKFGNEKRLSVKGQDMINVEVQKEFISTPWQDHQIHIVASSELLWDAERGEAIAFGNLIHEMMATIISKKDIDKTIIRFTNKGLLSINDQEEIKNTINKIVNHKDLAPYFVEGKVVMNERKILTNEDQILIPDRLVFDENKVTIIDYKTGKQEQKHVLQINNYALTLQDINYKINEKLLVYIGEEIIIKKV